MDVANDLLHNNFVYRRQKKSNVITVFCEYHFHIKHERFTWPPTTIFTATSLKDYIKQQKKEFSVLAKEMERLTVMGLK